MRIVAGYPPGSDSRNFIDGLQIEQTFDLRGTEVGEGRFGTIIEEYVNYEVVNEIRNIAHLVFQRIAVTPGVL